MQERLQQQQRLQDAASSVQAQQEAAIHETTALYSKLTASHATSRRPARPLPVPSPGTDHLAVRLSLSEEEEEEELCSWEDKHLEEVVARNQQLVQATNEEMRRAKRLQVRGRWSCDPHLSPDRGLELGGGTHDPAAAAGAPLCCSPVRKSCCG